MTTGRLSSCMLFSSVLVVTFSSCVAASSSNVQVLTDADFDQLTSHGSWLVEFYAPWCSHCRDLESTWDTLADELKGRVNVAKVDGTTEKVLLGRFSPEGFPTIYHIHGAEIREFAGHRTLQQLKDFALAGWKAEPALPLWQSPTSTIGRAWGRIQGVPARAQRFYRYLHEEKHYSQMTLLVGLLAIPLTLGLAMICMMDAYMVRHPTSYHGHQQ